MNKIKSLFTKVKNKARLFVAAAVSAVAVSAMAICASAEETTSSDVTSIISTAGAELIVQFTNLATAVVPVLISIAVIGLGLYSVVYLFKMAKAFFSKAAG